MTTGRQSIESRETDLAGEGKAEGVVVAEPDAHVVAELDGAGEGLAIDEGAGQGARRHRHLAALCGETGGRSEVEKGASDVGVTELRREVGREGT